MRPAHRRRTAAAIVAAIVLVSMATSPATARPGATPVHDSWIVMLAAGVDSSQGLALAKANGGAVGLVYHHALNGFQFKGSASAAEALRHNPNVLGVFADNAIALTETLPFGVKRIDAYVPGTPGGAYQSNYRGATARIGIIDTGIDLDHPDLAASIDQASGKNCVDPSLPPNDGYGHGTHVAGSAAAPLNGVGVVGVAPEATLVPIKVFDDAGNSSESLVLCGLEQLIGLNTDGDPANDVDVASMSFGESRSWGDCLSEPLHEAICRASATGMILVGGSGNSTADGGSFVPAAFPEVISVSALADFDGQPGGLAGLRPGPGPRLVRLRRHLRVLQQLRPVHRRDRPRRGDLLDLEGRGLPIEQRHLHGHAARLGRGRAHEGRQPIAHRSRCHRHDPPER